MTTMSEDEFNRDVRAAQRAADRAAVVIADNGQPAYVLLPIDEYRRLGAQGSFLVERLSMDDDRHIDFESANIEPQVPNF